MIKRLRMTDAEWLQLRGHLSKGRPEQAAFLFVSDRGSETYEVSRMRLLGTEDFEYQSEFHITLADHVRPEVIKEAWDSGTALVEIHSHRGRWAVKFSPSDKEGLRDFVPHVLWRLPNRPYGAVVVADTSLDSLTWDTGNADPGSAIELETESAVLRPTGLSLVSWNKDEYE